MIDPTHFSRASIIRATLLAGVAVMLAAGSSGPAARAQTDPAAQSLIDRLKPALGAGAWALATAPTPVWGSTPVLALAQPTPAQAVTARPRTAQRETTTLAPAVSIAVAFAPGTTILTADAELALAPLGRALVSPELAPFRFRIEAHTDSVGDAAVNQTLSERRAAAVREHLARVHDVDPGKLVSVGFGSSQLLVPTAPQVSEARNRRIQVVNIGN